MAEQHGDRAHIFDTSKWQRMESPERLARLDPPAMIGRLGLRHGMHVADLGCGTGLFTLELAKAVGETGRVFALDQSEEMLRVAGSKNLPPTVRVMHVDLHHDLPLPEGSLDCCFISFVLHEISPPEHMIAQMHHVLRHGGIVAVLEFREDAPEGNGPPKPRRIGVEKLTDMLAAQGFASPEVHWQSDREYLMVATRPDPAAKF
ncbi:MAG: class I SAM-dependent methyltransferase [Thermomicrobiales bacterium]